MSIASTLVHDADIRFQEAAVPLRSFVGCFWVITADQGAVLRLIPDAMSTVFAPVEEGRAPTWSLRGPLLEPGARRFDAPATVVGIRLRPGTAFLLTGVATETLVGRQIDLTNVAAFHALVAAEPHPGTASEYIATLERFLLARLSSAVVHPVVKKTLAELERTRGNVQASELAARSGVSLRHLNRLMRQWVGYPAKRLATIVRLQATLHDMERPPQPPAAALAIENGYFDQSHLTHDAVRFAGATPGRLALRAMAEFSKTRCDDLL